LDRLKAAGARVTDQRDVEEKRYKALARWDEAVIDRARSIVKELIAKRRRAAKARGRDFALIDDELKINSASSEQRVKVLGIGMQEVFEEATPLIRADRCATMSVRRFNFGRQSKQTLLDLNPNLI
jgi:hypothetical protein